MTDLAILLESYAVAARPPNGQVNLLRDKWNEHADEWIKWVRDPAQPDTYWRFHRKHFLELVPALGRLTLDIGSGEGRVGRDLQKAGHKVVGVDWSVTMCKAAATHKEAPAHVVAATRRSCR